MRKISESNNVMELKLQEFIDISIPILNLKAKRQYIRNKKIHLPRYPESK